MTDKTEQLTSGVKQGLRFKMFVFFKGNSNNKYRFVAL